MGAAAQEGLGVLPSESARMAIVVLSTLPIALTPILPKIFRGWFNNRRRERIKLYRRK